MSRRLTCPRGHQWETPPPSDGGTDVFRAVCPVCGATPRSVSPSITVAPGRSAPASPTTDPVASVSGGSGRVFWIATLCVVLAGVVCLIALPVVFRDFDWFGSSAPLMDDRTVTVRSGDTQRLHWDAPLVEKATVTVKSPGNPVNVYLVAASEVEAAARNMERGMPPPITLAGKTWVEDATLEITPGKKPFALLIQTATRKADVAVTVRGR